jgi:hypothetical protein
VILDEAHHAHAKARKTTKDTPNRLLLLSAAVAKKSRSLLAVIRYADAD